jgi:hypothetical protein
MEAMDVLRLYELDRARGQARRRPPGLSRKGASLAVGVLSAIGLAILLIACLRWAMEFFSRGAAAL